VDKNILDKTRRIIQEMVKELDASYSRIKNLRGENELQMRAMK